MFIELQGGPTVQITFQHNFRDKRPYSEVRISWWGPVTDDSVQEYLTVAYGQAHVHPKDAPCRRIGRKIALARALQGTGFDKTIRTQVWHQLMHKYKVRFF